MSNQERLWQIGLSSLHECLDDEWGVLASDRASNYGTIFGRDALITASLLLEVAGRNPADEKVRAIIEKAVSQSLRSLIRLQGTEERDKNEEQPGKIIHEYWTVASPRLRKWQWPLHEGRYYGSIDATPLFVTVAAEFRQSFPDHELIAELLPAVGRAMQWLERYGFDHPGGLVAYRRRNPSLGVIHQVWKDAGPDTVMTPDLRFPSEPIAWVELQAYAVAAVRAYQELRKSVPELPETRLELADLVEHLEKDFWSDDERGFVMAIDGEGNQLPVTSSNQGHALWTRALHPLAARSVAGRLIESDMLTAYGLRTVSEHSYLYDPWSRQRGAIWPYDNAVAALGMEHYGLKEEARLIAERVATGMRNFETAVELWSVLSGEELADPAVDRDPLLKFSLPNHEAATHQAWSAAGLLYLSTLL